MLITDEVFRAFLECETKSYLSFVGLDDPPSEYPNWQRHFSEEFKRKCLAHLCAGFHAEQCFVGALPGREEENKCRLVLDCPVQTQRLKSTIHALERLGPPDRPTQHPYIPIRFIPTEKIARGDKLLLAFDALVLSKASGKMPPFGKIIHGTELKIIRVRVAELMKTTCSLVRRIAAQQANATPPPLVINKHCAECAFQSRCRQVALEKDDLSLLSGMSEKEQKKRREKGIFSVTQLSYTFRPRRKSKRAASEPEKYHHELKALAIRERKIHVAGRPELGIGGTPVYLDVEGVPDRDFYYLIGLRIKNGDSCAQHSFWADDIAEERKIWTSFLQDLAQVENPQLIHYGSYETVFLKRMKERYGTGGKNAGLVAQLSAQAVNLLSVIYGQIYFPTYSNGLKEIAQYLGFRWSDEAASGANALMWRSKWEYAAEPDLKEKLITYNAEDCAALEWVTEAVTRLCLNGNGPGGPRDDNIVHTDSLSRRSAYHWGEESFSLPEFEKINQSAYWNYQRDKIYVRSNPRLKRLARKPPVKRQRCLPVNTVINCPAPERCPECLSTSFYKYDTCRKVVYDLKFNRTGIKRWIVRYQFHRYVCRACTAIFHPTRPLQTTSRHGLGLLAHIVYQLVELKIPQGAIADSITQLFSLPLHRNAVLKQKTRASEIYQVTYEGILRRILGGRLIHADETKINIKRGSGYVWVLTNLEEVAYLYTDTREGELVQSLLREFKGVLVTDFYAAYDSIDCPQQKCLIHLMRDLNDDLLKQPFNEELKGLTQAFAALLKPIVETIDRFGLKARHLRKHKAFVARFYQTLTEANSKTEIVAKYKKRFEKNRYKLFTFLDYNGVPWNNNNAEHAIKAFALLRTALRGASSGKGIREYLTLLSICETCKYKGVNFLAFLRSGEKDIDPKAH
jgi:predicted RecB family nuclease